MRINVKDRTAAFVRKDPKLISAATSFTNSTTLMPAVAGLRPRVRLEQVILLRSADRIHVLGMDGREFKTWLLPGNFVNGTSSGFSFPARRF